MMRVMKCLLVPALALLAAGAAHAQLTFEVSDAGVVAVDVGGTRCLEQFQVILPSPDWKGGAGPQNCRKETLGPGRVRVTGQMSDGQPCANFSLETRTQGDALELTWQVTFTRDYAAETVRLNGLLPCALSAGKGAWFVRRPTALQWALLPAVHGRPGGSANDWGFDWFGWLLPGDHGLRFRPLRGLTDMYLQDARDWGDEHFQTCWTLATKGVQRQGTVLGCALHLEPLAGADLVDDARRLGLSLLSTAATLTPAPGGVQGGAEVRNVNPSAQQVSVAWAIHDDVGTALRQGKESHEVPGLGSATVPVSAPEAASGDYRLTVEVTPAGGAAAQTAQTRLVAPPPSARPTLSLDGEWQVCPAAEGEAAPPAAAEWKPAQVPGRLDGAARNRWWLRRSFQVPAAMAGKRLKLRFGAVNHKAEVFLNGRRAGEHVGGNLPFELDLTGLARPGSNELLVAVTNWTALCTKPPARVEVAQFEHPASKLPPASVIGPIGGDFLLTGIWQSVSLTACDALHVADVCVRTSVRRGMLRVATTVCNEDPAARKVRLEGEVADSQGPALQLPAQTLTLASGEEREVVVEVPWPAAHRWSLDDPHLYRLVTRLREGDVTRDQVLTRFGFREVWTEGPRFVLNGVPMKLFATSAWAMDSWEAAREHIQRMKQAGTRSMRLHTQPWQPYILDAADELGMLMVDEAAVYCYAPAFAVEDPRLWSNYAAHLAGLARRDRNHPAVALYSLENEIISCGGDPKVWEPHLGALADGLRQVDPTRLITCESDLDPVGKMDVIGMHYPREYWAGFTLYPDKCWWMDQEIPYIGRQYIWKRDKPLYIGEFDGGFPAWYPQYQAFWLGEEAYVARGRFNAATPNSRARREMIEMEVQAYRSYGVTGLCPWFDPDEVSVFGPVAYAPITLAVRERTHNFYAGQPIHRTITVTNDSFGPARLQLRWHATGLGLQPQAGGTELDLPPCSARQVPVALQAPAVKARAKLRLVVSLLAGGKVVARTEQALSVFPRPTERMDGAVAKAYLYDPAKQAGAALEAVGVKATPLERISALPADAKLLIIGPQAFTAGDDASWAPGLAQYVAGGGHVVCLAQERYPQRWLPLRVEIDPRHTTTIAFPRATESPILAGLAAEDLRFWQPDHIVATRSLLKPTRGNFIPLIEAGGIRSAIDDMNGLNWAPLLEVPFGQGRYWLCQLPLTERVGVEPVAEVLLRRLIRCALMTPPTSQSRVGLIADGESSLKTTLDGLGLVYDSLPAPLDAAALQADQVLIAGGGPEAWKTVREHASELAARVRQGAVLWLNNLTPAEADITQTLLGAPLTLQSAEAQVICLGSPDPLTRGLSNHDLYWRDRPIWDQWTLMRKAAEFLPASLPPGAVALTDPPALVKIPLGKGFLLLNQLLWDSTTQNRNEGMRIASILLTNLCATLRVNALGRVNEAGFEPVDLSAWCNLGFEGDPGSGWMGHPGAMKSFPTGRQVLGGVPFTILTPAQNGGRSLIALRGKERPAYPAAAEGIRVGLKARALWFLHTCAWGGVEGTELAAYVIHYQDGTAQRLPLRTGVELADWYAEPGDLPYAQVAWRGPGTDKQGDIGVYVMRWVNPHPEKTIATLDFVSAQREPVPVLIAVSAEK